MNMKLSFTELLRQKDSDAVIYTIGILTAAAIAVGWLIYRLICGLTGFTAEHICVFRAVTGFYCPGCGGTRAFYYLIHGNIFKSLIYHPFIIYAVAVSAVFYISQTLRFVSKNRIKAMHMSTGYVIAGAALIAVNWIVKNIMLACFRIAVIG